MKRIDDDNEHCESAHLFNEKYNERVNYQSITF